MEQSKRFAICIEADPEDDVELQKVYPVIDDADAEKDGMIRVVDESGEDYLYETARFLVLTLPAPQAHTLLRSIEVAASTHT
jgi:predicted NAD/FAD-dependent oxidoreductase